MLGRAEMREWKIRGDEFLRVLYWLGGLVIALAAFFAAWFIVSPGPVWLDWLSVIPAAAALGLTVAVVRLLREQKKSWESGRTVETVRGDKVRSRAEARLANWLHARGYDYRYEPELCGYRPDFYLPELNVIIEHWGLTTPEYVELRRRKVNAYRTAGYGVISSEGWDGIEEELERKLYAFDKDVYRRAVAVR